MHMNSLNQNKDKKVKNQHSDYKNKKLSTTIHSKINGS